MAATDFATSVPTSFLPLTTQGSSVGSECASAIYKQANDGNFLGWDPWWVTEVNTALSTCWPTQATLWWNQDSSETTTVLGKSFVCPHEYHEVLTSSIDAHTTQTFCCPTSYSLYNVDFDRPSFPSQCISTLTDGETLSYRTVSDLATGGSTNSATSTTLNDEVVTIYGIPVNGLNVIASTSASGSTSTSSGTVTTSTGAAGEVVTVTASADAPSARSSGSSSSSKQHSVVGVAVGASVGAVFGIMLLAAVVFVVWRRRRRYRGHTASATTHEMDAPLGVFGKTSTSPVVPPDVPKLATELDSNRYYEAYELPADTRGGRGRDLA